MGFESLLLLEDRISNLVRLSAKQKRYIKKVVTANKDLINRPDFYTRLYSLNDAQPQIVNEPLFKVLVGREICSILDSGNCPVIP